MTIKSWMSAGLLLLATSAYAADSDRFVSKLALPTGQTVVVAEGDFEARSIGSFSVRLYEAAAAPDETTFFSSGLIRPRDGVVEKVMLADIDGDKRQEVVVLVRSAGSGSYLSAHAFTPTKNKLVYRGAVMDLAANADPIKALRRLGKKR